jgi:hypothetical protein
MAKKKRSAKSPTPTGGPWYVVCDESDGGMVTDTAGVRDIAPDDTPR